jgi:hypothetical protein
MQCANPSCQHVVIVTGESTVDWDIEDTPSGPDQVWKSSFSPKAFSDAPPIFRSEAKYPDELRSYLQHSFHLYWVDKSSCLNKIRSCVELILTDQKIAKYRNSNGKRRTLTLHSRIEIFKEKKPEAAELLMALKWLGNEGSHSHSKPKPIQSSDLLDAFELLEHAVNSIYSPKSSQLSQRAKKINKRKGR